MDYCIVALLVAAAHAQVALLLSDPSTTTITSPSGLSVGVESYHTGVNPNYLGTGAQWIWNNQADKWPNGYSNTFQALFSVDCYQSPATLKIVADNEFTAYLNGMPTPVLSGSNWLKPDAVDIRLQCGVNNLTVVATNRDNFTPAGLAFSITQFQENCYNCPSPLSYYDSSSCSCQCVGGCNCREVNPNWVWSGFPNCGCTCPRVVKCGDRKEFNPKSCSCECRNQICPPGYVFSTTNCSCIPQQCPNVIRCPKWKEWTWLTCSCDCPSITNCQSGFRWDEDRCQCIGRPLKPAGPRIPALMTADAGSGQEAAAQQS